MKKVLLISSLLILSLCFNACDKKNDDPIKEVVKKIVPKQIALSKTEITLKLGTTQELKASVLPEKADQTLKVELDDKEIISYENNIITPKKIGKANINFTSSNGIKASCLVNVIDKYDHKPAEIKLYTKEINIELGSTAKLTYSVLPADSDQTLKIVNSNPNVAELKDGIITPKILGDTKITFTTINNKTASCLIHVLNKSPKEITFTKSEITIHKGEPTKLEYTLKPSDAVSEVKYTSSNEEIVKITEDKKVIGLKTGFAIVTATTKNGLKAECKVIVNGSRPIKVGDIVFTAISENESSLELKVSSSIVVFINNAAKTIETSQEIKLNKEDELFIPLAAKKEITSISCKKCAITGDFTEFTALEEFSAESITNEELNLEGSLALESLRIHDAKSIKSINCNKAINLTSIHVSASTVGNIDLSGLNKLSSIQFVGCTNMTELIIPNKQIIKTINITSSNIESLDLAGTENLVRCEIEKTPIKVLDLTSSQVSRFRAGSDKLTTVKYNTTTYKNRYFYGYMGKEYKDVDNKRYRDLSIYSEDFTIECFIGKEPVDGKFTGLTSLENVMVRGLMKFTNKGKGFVQFIKGGAKWYYKMSVIKATSKWGYDKYTYEWVKE
ncbi:MAG: Ig-like domain-containing protein [Marinifilaceae bacterium]|jgi:hypothetical protein|nr:Ig-like domain-containing protein [Marinifilaceae bacterium]